MICKGILAEVYELYQLVNSAIGKLTKKKSPF